MVQCIVISPVCGFVCVCLCVGLLPLYLEIACINSHHTGFVGKGSDHLQLIKSPLSIWPHLFHGADHEKRRGEQLKWSLAFRPYIGSFPCAQNWYQDQFIQPSWAEFLMYLAYVCALCVRLCFLICLYVPILLCFPWQLSHLPYSFWR